MRLPMSTTFTFPQSSSCKGSSANHMIDLMIADDTGIRDGKRFAECTQGGLSVKRHASPSTRSLSIDSLMKWSAYAVLSCP